jgi:molybdenum cofactor cytidylyltransferase
MHTDSHDRRRHIANHTVSRANTSQTGSTVTPIILAAGAGTRFGDVGHKLLAVLPSTAFRPSESVVMRSTTTALRVFPNGLVVVTGRMSESELGLSDLLRSNNLFITYNNKWGDGQATSMQHGLDVARERESDVAVIGLADQPGITPTAWQAVANAALGGAPIAVATYSGRRANPVALRRDVWDLLATVGDEGARSLMALRPELVREVPCVGSPTDIDTVEDLRRWQNN